MRDLPAKKANQNLARVEQKMVLVVPASFFTSVDAGLNLV
jgi:hypothetical protein